MAPSPQLSTNCTRVISKISFVADCTKGVISFLNLLVLLASSDGPGTTNTTTSVVWRGVCIVLLILRPPSAKFVMPPAGGQGTNADSPARRVAPSALNCGANTI